MKVLAALVLLVAPVAAIAATDRGPMAAPAFRLGDAAQPVRYDVRLAIDPRKPTFEGEVEIDFVVKRATQVLWLNATALGIGEAVLTQGSRAVAVEMLPGGEDFVGLRASFEAGPARVRFAFRGQLDPVGDQGMFRQEDGGDWYAFSQFQSVGARRAFPCFDEPQWKTPWRVAIDAPATEVAISNTPETSAARIAERPGWWRHEFAQTQPLPSYLVAFAVGPFDVVDGGTAGMKRTPLRYVAPRGRGAEARYAARVTPPLLERLEEYFGMPYPFEKLDAVAVPQLVSFGAMENVGMITYGSALMLARAHEETPRFREVYASFAAHEMAHMWFGNLVTLAWWDDTWLNEGFASWMGSKIEYAFEPAWDNGMWASRSREMALAADRLASARSIVAPVDSRNAIDDAFDEITYNKGEEVLAMFEAWIGPERFRAAVKAFLARHAGSTATSEDFFRALGEASGDSERALAALRGFVGQPGAPMIDVTLDCAGAPALQVAQRRFRPKGSAAKELEWTTPACFSFRVDGKELTQCAAVDKATRRIALEGAQACPAWVLGNAGGRGHYVVRYEAGLLRRNASAAASLPSHAAQAFVRDTLLLAQSGLIPVTGALDVAAGAFGHESPNVRLAAVALLEGLRDAELAPAQRQRKDRIVAERVMPLARELGWSPRAADSDDTRAFRAALLRFAADRDAGARLRPEARRLAARWLEAPDSVDATIAPAALDVTGRFANPATFGRLEQAAASVDGVRERSMILGAMARVRDPALRARMLALTLDGPRGEAGLDGRSALRLLDRALRDDENRGASMDHALAHLDALEAKLPRDALAALLVPMGGACTRPQRDALAAAYRDRAARYMSGALRYSQALENIDLCIAARLP